MSDIRAMVHQILFPLGLRPAPRWGSLQRSPRPLNWLQGVLLLREGKKRKGKSRQKKGKKEKKGRGGEGKGKKKEGKKQESDWPRAPQSLNPVLRVRQNVVMRYVPLLFCTAYPSHVPSFSHILDPQSKSLF